LEVVIVKTRFQLTAIIDEIKADLGKALHQPVSEKELKAEAGTCTQMWNENLLACAEYASHHDRFHQDCIESLHTSMPFWSFADCTEQSYRHIKLSQLFSAIAYRAVKLTGNTELCTSHADPSRIKSYECIDADHVKPASTLAEGMATEFMWMNKITPIVSWYTNGIFDTKTAVEFSFRAYLSTLPEKERNELIIREIESIDPELVDTADLDGSGGVDVAEALACALTSTDRERFSGIFEYLGLKHPIDIENYPPEIVARIEEIRDEVNGKIRMSPDDAGYCEAFVPAFMERAKGSYDEGGLCIGYTEPRTLDIHVEPEMTSSEAFELCLDPNENYGSCTEKTYMSMGAMMVAGVPCRIDSNITENHLYPSYAGMSIDPSEIGAIGWAFESDPVASYTFNIPIKSSDAANSITSRIASQLSPEAFWDVETAKASISSMRDRAEKDGKLRSEDVEHFLSIFDDTSRSNPNMIKAFRWMSGLCATLPLEQRIEFGKAVMLRWPTNPYSFLVLHNSVLGNETAVKAFNGDASAKKQQEALIKRVADSIEKIAPSSGYAQVLRSIAINPAGNKAHAEAQLKKAIEINPNSAIAHQMLGANALSEGNMVEAERLIARSISIAPNLSNNHCNLALIKQMQGDMHGARVETLKERTVYADNYMATLLEVDLALFQGSPNTALSILFQTHAHEVLNNPPSYLASKLITIHAMRGDFKKAEQLLKKLDDPVEMHMQAYMIEFIRGDLKAAKAHVDALPETPYKLAMAMAIAMSSGEWDEAHELLSALKRLPQFSSSSTREYEAHIFLSKGEYAKARKIFQDMYTQNPQSADIRATLIQMDIFEGNLEKAGHDLGALMAEQHGNVSHQFIALFFLLRAGRAADALNGSQDVLKLAPENTHAQMIKAYALVELGRPSEALAIGSTIATELPKLPVGYRIMGLALARMKRFDEAREAVTKAKAVEVSDPVVWPLISTKIIEDEIAKAEAAKKK
jgi:predicted Zn-dependent protease